MILNLLSHFDIAFSVFQNIDSAATSETSGVIQWRG